LQNTFIGNSDKEHEMEAKDYGELTIEQEEESGIPRFILWSNGNHLLGVVYLKKTANDIVNALNALSGIPTEKLGEVKKAWEEYHLHKKLDRDSLIIELEKRGLIKDTVSTREENGAVTNFSYYEHGEFCEGWFDADNDRGAHVGQEYVDFGEHVDDGVSPEGFSQFACIEIKEITVDMLNAIIGPEIKPEST
jgi:hypothetical protein